MSPLTLHSLSVWAFLVRYDPLRGLRFTLLIGMMSLAILAGDALTVQAQPRVLPDSLTLESATTLLMENNPGLQAAQAAADYMTQSARDAALWPNPSVRATQTNIPLPAGGTERETQLGLTQTLPYPGRKRAERRAATHVSEAARFSYQEAQAQAFHELRTRYLGVAAAEARVRALQQLTDAVAEAATAADVRYEEGDFSPFGRARMRVAVADFENALADAKVSRRNARLRLAAYILPDSTLQSSAPETLTSYTVAATLHAPPLDEAYDMLRTQALSQRGLLKAAEARVDAQQQQLRAAQLQRIPDVTLSLGPLGRNQPLGMEWGYHAGISINLPMWDTGRTRVRIQEAQQRRAQARRSDAQRAVEVELRTAYTEAQSYRTRIDRLSGEVLASTDSLLQNARYVYVEGELSLVGLLDAMQAARSARLLQIDLVAGYLRRLYALEYAMGVRPTDTPPLLPATLLEPTG